MVIELYFATNNWEPRPMVNGKNSGAMGAVFGAALLLQSGWPAVAAPVSRWEAEIAAFERADKTNPPPQGAILFVGSSSIRLWRTLAADFPKRRVINRGFGGSEVADSLALADRIILPYKPRMVLLYAGDNDIAAGGTPALVVSNFQALVKKIHSASPETRIHFISIKPSPARWKLADQVRAANQLAKTFTGTDQRLGFIDVFTPMIGDDGQPRPELFAEDKLHLSAKGYKLWTGIIGPHLEAAR